MSAICPECDSPIDVDEYDVDIGDELTCSECGSLLRVSSDSPVEFEVADADTVRVAADELKEKGFTLLHDAYTEPWGQTVARLQSIEGAIIGISYAPTMHS